MMKTRKSMGSRSQMNGEQKRRCIYQIKMGRGGVPLLEMSLFFLIMTVLWSSTNILAVKREYIQSDFLTESVKTMLEEGIPSQDIVNSIKHELSLNRIKELVGRMYDGEDLSEEEMSDLKTGEIQDNDEELIAILEKFEIIDVLNVTSDHNTGYDERGVENRSSVLTDQSYIDNLNKKFQVDKESFVASGGIVLDQEQLLPKPDYAYSPYDLVRLVMAEESIYKPLNRYIKKVEAKLRILKSYAVDYEDTSQLIAKGIDPSIKMEKRAEAIVSNPLASFRLMRRFAFKLPEVWNSLAEDLEEVLWNDLSQMRLKYQPPNEQDWKESIEALLRIQYYNGYGTKEFAKGSLGSTHSNIKLTAEECMEIGLRALALKKYDFALEWLYLAKNNYLENDDSSEIDTKFLEQSLQFAVKEHNKVWETHPGVYEKPHIFTEKIFDLKSIEDATKQSTVIKEMAKQKRKKEEYDYHITYNFMSLCGGENLQTEKEKSRLKCWLERSKHPYFLISPIKSELLSEEPYLLQIYEVIGDTQIENVKLEATSKLERSQVVNYNNPNSDDVSLVRTSSQTWIPQWDLKRVGLENLPKLIEKITGLTTRKFGSSEDFQVACYGTSHHYDEHLDAVQDIRRTAKHGERLATFMLYLNTVEEGGKTAFPVAGTAANPVKGSAVFWYNLKKNGEPDKRTWHGGCPVIFGLKYVMNNWILLYENMHNRPCANSEED